MHAKMDFYPGARAFGVLARDPRLDPWLCSNSIDETVVQNKRYNLSEFLAEDYILFRQMLNIIGTRRSKHVSQFSVHEFRRHLAGLFRAVVILYPGSNGLQGFHAPA